MRFLLRLRPFVLPVVLVAAWWVVSAGSTSPYFPPLSDIVVAFRDNWLFERAGTDVVPSLVRMFSGYLIAIAIGVALGIPLGLVEPLRVAFDPTLEYLRALPVIALIPAFIVLTGIGDTTKIIMIVLGAVWPVLLGTQDGVRGADPVLVDMTKGYRLSTLQRVRFIVLPGALPQIFAGARTALAISFIVMVTSEMLAATSGIGYFVLQAQATFAVTDMWSGLLLLGILGYLFNILFVRVQNRALRWHTGLRGGSEEGAR
jgi:ABC-type nitrate/sulfonate/bicarbonate transport system permease component